MMKANVGLRMVTILIRRPLVRILFHQLREIAPMVLERFQDHGRHFDFGRVGPPGRGRAPVPRSCVCSLAFSTGLMAHLWMPTPLMAARS
jgi:hypothetical protein